MVHSVFSEFVISKNFGDFLELKQKICNELKSVGIPFKEGQIQSAAGMDSGSVSGFEADSGSESVFGSKIGASVGQNPGSAVQLILIINDRFRRSAEVVLQNLMLKMTFTSDQETIYDNKIKLLWQKN